MKPYQRGDVVLIDVPIPSSGHVQGGKRPWVIVQNNMGNQFSPTSIVVPLTTKLKRLEVFVYSPGRDHAPCRYRSEKRFLL